MDPITTAVLEALGKLAEPAVKDAYDGLKAYLVRKFGKPSEVVKAVETLEAKPDSAGRRATLAEELVTAGAARDAELLKLAQAVMEAFCTFCPALRGLASCPRRRLSASHSFDVFREQVVDEGLVTQASPPGLPSHRIKHLGIDPNGDQPPGLCPQRRPAHASHRS